MWLMKNVRHANQRVRAAILGWDFRGCKGCHFLNTLDQQTVPQMGPCKNDTRSTLINCKSVLQNGFLESKLDPKLTHTVLLTFSLTMLHALNTHSGYIFMKVRYSSSLQTARSKCYDQQTDFACDNRTVK